MWDIHAVYYWKNETTSQTWNSCGFFFSITCSESPISHDIFFPLLWTLHATTHFDYHHILQLRFIIEYMRIFFLSLWIFDFLWRAWEKLWFDLDRYKNFFFPLYFYKKILTRRQRIRLLLQRQSLGRTWSSRKRTRRPGRRYTPHQAAEASIISSRAPPRYWSKPVTSRPAGFGSFRSIRLSALSASLRESQSRTSSGSKYFFFSLPSL